jgi:outer membrane phospholipase A
MNERIKELAQQVEMAANKDDHVDVKIMMAKFAELLLKDVLAIVKNNTPNPDPYSRYGMQEAAERTANYIRDEIKYQFGVK